jgi:short-subunit dehydrogenase
MLFKPESLFNMKNPKTILITGASSGIGLALVKAYATRDTRLLLTGRDETRLERAASDARTFGAQVETTTVPVTDRAGFEKVILAWDDAYPIDLVIANAGISGGSSSGAGFFDILNTNLQGTLHSTLPLIERMKARKRGQIAFMSSMAGWRGMPTAPAYSVSKMAVRAMGESLRPRLAADNVQVNVIFPGFVKTPLTDVNPFPMPFLMDADAAAQKIKQGLARNKARIGFPWPMMLLSRVIAALPLGLGDYILSKAPKKPE